MREPAAPTSAAALRQKLLERDPAKHWRSLLVLLGTMVIFAMFEGMSFKPDGAAMLIGVLLFHELGHLAGMKLFGYRDLRIFVIPLLGAATGGKPVDVSAAKRALVLLLGPLPGLVLALVLVLVLRPADKTLEWNLVMMLAALNGFNLLPLEPFDGGKLVRLVLSSRRPVVVRVARELTAKFPTLPGQLEDASDEVLELIHQQVALEVLQGRTKDPDAALKATAHWARIVYDRARAERPDALASFALILVYLSGLALAAGSVIVLALLNRH